jgi:hypothetical protein
MITTSYMDTPIGFTCSRPERLAVVGSRGPHCQRGPWRPRRPARGELEGHHRPLPILYLLGILESPGGLAGRPADLVVSAHKHIHTKKRDQYSIYGAVHVGAYTAHCVIHLLLLLEHQFPYIRLSDLVVLVYVLARVDLHTQHRIMS